MTDERRWKADPRAKHFCDCDRVCMLTSAELRRKRVRCRYRHGQVKPLGYFIVLSGSDSDPPCNDSKDLHVAGSDSEEPD